MSGLNTPAKRMENDSVTRFSALAAEQTAVPSKTDGETIQQSRLDNLKDELETVAYRSIN